MAFKYSIFRRFFTFFEDHILYTPPLKSFIFYSHFFFVFSIRQKNFPPWNSKTLYVKCTESRQREPCCYFRAVCED